MASKEDFLENVGAFTGELFNLNDFIKDTSNLTLRNSFVSSIPTK